MSREEVEKALQELKEQHGSSIINITPNEAEEKESGVELLSEAEDATEKVSA